MRQRHVHLKDVVVVDWHLKKRDNRHAMTTTTTTKHLQNHQLSNTNSYVVATGLVDTMSRRLLKIRESVENHGSVVLSLLATIGLLTKFGDLCPKGAADQTKFLAVVRSTELLGTISLLHSTVIPLGEYGGIGGFT